MTTADARMPALTGPHRPGAWSLVRPVRPAQLVVWAIAVAACLVDPSIPVLLVAALAVATTSVRVAGRHFAGWTAIWVRHRLLQHDGRHPGDDPLLVLAPDFRLRQHHDRAGNSFGVVGVEDGWTAVLRLAPGRDPDLSTVTEVLRQACDNADIPLAGAQVLVRTEGARREYLLAVRYRPAEAPLAALSRGTGELGEHRAITRAALGVLGALADAGYPATVLEAGELAAELRETLGIQGELLAGSRRTSSVVDGWWSWSAAGTTQVCFAAKTDLDSAFAVSAPDSSLTVVSYHLRRTHLGRLHEHVTIRVANHRGTRKPLRAGDLDVPVLPLYGRHEAAVRGTLPLALP